MKHVWIILAFAAAAVFAVPTGHASANEDTHTRVGEKDKAVTVYYFHSTRRCKTCLSIERVTRGVIKDRYAKETRVQFRSVNIEEEENEALVERYEVAGSALLVCRGEKKADLTTAAFQYAVSSPEKLQKKLIAAIDAQLK